MARVAGIDISMLVAHVLACSRRRVSRDRMVKSAADSGLSLLTAICQHQHIRHVTKCSALQEYPTFLSSSARQFAHPSQNSRRYKCFIHNIQRAALHPCPHGFSQFSPKLPLFPHNLLHNLQLAAPPPRKSILPLLPKPEQLLDIRGVHLVHIRRVGRLALQHGDGPPDDDVQGPAVGHHADIVVEDTAGVEERDREAH